MHYKLVDKKPKTSVFVFETNDGLAGILHGIYVDIVSGCSS